MSRSGTFSAEDERQHHDKFYSEHGELVSSNRLFDIFRERTIRTIVDSVPDLKDRHVLSLGSGLGGWEIILSPLCKHIHGIELSPVGVMKSTERARRLRLHNVSFEVGDVLKLDTSRKYDFVLILGVLHHVPAHVELIIQDSFAILNTGGYFFSVDPSSRRIVRYFKWLMRNKRHEYCTIGEKDLDPKAVAACLVKAGFVSPQIGWADFALGPIGYIWPNMPGALVSVTRTVDNLLLRTPLIQTLCSSFSLLARKP